MKPRTILLAPTLAQGQGTGHLRRALDIDRLSRHKTTLLVGLDEDESLQPCESEIKAQRVCSGKDEVCVVVADRRSTDMPTFEALSRCGSVVGVDEGGPARAYMAYLIDTLPGPLTGANRSGLRYLDLPDRVRESVTVPPRLVLITFGGEDREGLTGPVLRSLLASGLFEADQLTAVIGSHFTDHTVPPGVSTLRQPARLSDHLHRYDLVITSFGLTCFETLAVGVPVALVSPSGYHRRLARMADLPQVGLRKLKVAALRKLIQDSQRLARSVERTAVERRDEAVSITSVLDDMVLSSPACPVCGSGSHRAVTRFADRTYFQCGGCAICYMVRFTPQPIHYDDAYFSEQYERQYGRTYIEDFPAIKLAAVGRLGFVQRALGRGSALSQSKVLDVGCAYGPFLSAAADLGAVARGVEVSQSAAHWVEKNLGLSVWVGPFQEFSGDEPFDVLTMWYVIEHFPRLEPVLRRVNRNLRMGGVFAFSTPNDRGISGRRNRGRFLEQSPHDHYTLWNPRSAHKVLRRFGFRIVAIRVTGHHPERFAWGTAVGQESPGWRLTGTLSRCLRLGDTFEVYARKERELDG